MATGLGAAKSGQIRIQAYFSSAVVEGQAVAIDVSALNTLDSLDDVVVTATTYTGNTEFLGVVDKAYSSGDYGEVIIWGPVQALTGTDIAAGEAVQADTVDSTFLDYATGDKHGIAMEAGAASGTTWIFVTAPPGLGGA